MKVFERAFWLVLSALSAACRRDTADIAPGRTQGIGSGPCDARARLARYGRRSVGASLAGLAVLACAAERVRLLMRLCPMPPAHDRTLFTAPGGR